MGEQERKLEAEKNPETAVEILEGIREALKIPKEQTVSEFMKKEIVLLKDVILATITTEKGMSYYLGMNEGVTIGNLEKILGHYLINIPETIGMIKMQLARQMAEKQKTGLYVPGHVQGGGIAGGNGKNRIEGK